MVNYAYLKKKQMAIYPLPLLIFCQTYRRDLLPVKKWRHTRGTEYLLSKVNFPAKSAIYTTFQLFPIKM